jgi:hypothetical protein
MTEHKNWAIRAAACVAIALMLDGYSAAAPKRLIAKAYCECGCVREHEGNGGETIIENLGTKKFEAPGGDAQSCSGQNGTECRSGGVSGKLANCSGYVERGDAGGPSTRIPDITITPLAPAQ